MWGGSDTYINGTPYQHCFGTNIHLVLAVTFDYRTSHGQVAMAIYEWRDVKYFGVVTSESDNSLPVSCFYCIINTLHLPSISRKRTYARRML